jgi:pyruvate/2-oxoglutarate dehydrogenase complex dihydrolipoamide dehydrogenase (E3) component
VILATGGEKIVPPISGIDKPCVCDAWQILDDAVKPGGNVLVVGGGLIGMETADYMSERGSAVTLIEMLNQSPVLKITSHGYMLHKRLRDKKALLLFGRTLKAIGDGKVEVEANGELSTISPIDQVVIAVGLKSRNDLAESLEKAGICFTVVGDDLNPRRIIEATEEGARAAWEL